MFFTFRICVWHLRLAFAVRAYHADQPYMARPGIVYTCGDGHGQGTKNLRNFNSYVITPGYGIKGWLAVCNTWDTTDAGLGLSYPLKVGPGAGLTLNTYAGPIKKPCVSLVATKLAFLSMPKPGLSLQ